jgi:hypothetical protein
MTRGGIGHCGHKVYDLDTTTGDKKNVYSKGCGSRRLDLQKDDIQNFFRWMGRKLAWQPLLITWSDQRAECSSILPVVFHTAWRIFSRMLDVGGGRVSVCVPRPRALRFVRASAISLPWWPRGQPPRWLAIQNSRVLHGKESRVDLISWKGQVIRSVAALEPLDAQPHLWDYQLPLSLQSKKKRRFLSDSGGWILLNFSPSN